MYADCLCNKPCFLIRLVVDVLFVRLFTLTPVSHSIRTIFLIPFEHTKGFEELCEQKTYIQDTREKIQSYR